MLKSLKLSELVGYGFCILITILAVSLHTMNIFPMLLNSCFIGGIAMLIACCFLVRTTNSGKKNSESKLMACLKALGYISCLVMALLAVYLLIMSYLHKPQVPYVVGGILVLIAGQFFMKENLKEFCCALLLMFSAFSFWYRIDMRYVSSSLREGKFVSVILTDLKTTEKWVVTNPEKLVEIQETFRAVYTETTIKWSAQYKIEIEFSAGAFERWYLANSTISRTRTTEIKDLYLPVNRSLGKWLKEVTTKDPEILNAKEN